MSEQNPPSAAKRNSWPRWLWFGLITSIALNLLVVGAVAGFLFRHGPPGRGIMNRSVFGYVKSLPAERRREFRRKTRELRAQIRPMRRAVRHARRLADEVLVAEPFDRAAYALARQRIVEAKMKLLAAAQTFFIETAAGMTAQERRGFVEWRKKFRGRRWREGGRRGSGGGPGGAKSPPK